MDLARLLRHLFSVPGAMGRTYPAAAMKAIEEAVKRAESTNRGEIRFAAEAALDGSALLAGQSARERALEVFSLLRVWDTEENNGVLIYLLLADHDVEIVADRGLNGKVSPAEWEAICHRMEREFKRRAFGEGVVAGIEEVSRLLAGHFPARPGDRNELPDRPAVL